MYSNLKFRKKGWCEDGIKFEIEKQRERENGVKYEKQCERENGLNYEIKQQEREKGLRFDL